MDYRKKKLYHITGLIAPLQLPNKCHTQLPVLHTKWILVFRPGNLISFFCEAIMLAKDLKVRKHL